MTSRSPEERLRTVTDELPASKDEKPWDEKTTLEQVAAALFPGSVTQIAESPGAKTEDATVNQAGNAIQTEGTRGTTQGEDEAQSIPGRLWPGAVNQTAQNPFVTPKEAAGDQVENPLSSEGARTSIPVNDDDTAVKAGYRGSLQLSAAYARQGRPETSGKAQQSTSRTGEKTLDIQDAEVAKSTEGMGVVQGSKESISEMAEDVGDTTGQRGDGAVDGRKKALTKYTGKPPPYWTRK